jgi:hypothetical protein
MALPTDLVVVGYGAWGMANELGKELMTLKALRRYVYSNSCYY